MVLTTSSVRLWFRSLFFLWVTESKLFLRQPIAAFFTFVFPVTLFLLFGSIFGDSYLWDRPDLRYIDFYAPALISAYVGQAGLVNVTSFLALYRQVGVLKRYVASPVTLCAYLCAHIAVQFTALLTSSLILAVVAECVFDVDFRGHWASVLIVAVISTACFFALGFLVSGLFKSPRGIQATGQFLFLAMFFVSGATFPRQLFPEWLLTLSKVSPLTHVVETFTGIWLGDPISQHINSLILLAFITALAYVISSTTFKWEV
ncbi:MAG: ABC transporter permease [Gemmatimonadota bacterium]|nr:ABC transporter permease [Gemmatimonadota bacterium]